MSAAEEWRPVVGHEKAYEVSSLGRVRSLDRLVKNGPGSSRRCRGQLLRPGRLNGGHLTVAIGKGNSRLVHHLVLEAFVGPRPPGHEACHEDDTADHNVLDNLSWGTRTKNLLDAVRNGKKPVGAGHPNAKLTASQASAVAGLKGRVRPCELGRVLGVSESVPRGIWSGRIWKSVQPMQADLAVEVIYGAQR